MYAKVIDGKVVDRRARPESQRTSNIWLNPIALKEEGWLPIERSPPPAGSVLKSWKYEVLKTKVKEIPIYKIDKKPSAKKWEKVEKGELKQHPDYEEQEYVVTERTLSDFKSSVKAELFKEVSQEVERNYGASELILAQYKVIDSKDIKKFLAEQKVLLDEALTKLSNATTHEEVAEIRVYPQEEVYV